MRKLLGSIVWSAVLSVIFASAAIIVALLSPERVSLVTALTGAGVVSAVLALRATP